MLRRQILFAITLILLAVIIFMLLRGRSAEREHEAQNIKLEEIVSGSSSSVRAILPRELEIVETRVSWARNFNNKEGKEAATARHDITIRNTGKGFYVSLWLRMEYIDEKGRPVEIRTREINGDLPPGKILHADFFVDGLPDAASDFSAAILSADLEASVEQ